MQQHQANIITTASQLIAGLEQIPTNWVLTPVDGNKRPYRKNWQAEEPLSRGAIIEELRSGRAKGYGIRTGEVSNGILAIDVDGESAKPLLREKSGGDLPHTVSFKSGKPGRGQLLYRVPAKHWHDIKNVVFKTGVKSGDGKDEQLEFRWYGLQSVLPPSIHPETGRYHWERSPEDQEIAQCPKWVIELMLNHNQPVPSTPAPKPLQTRQIPQISTKPPLEIFIGRDDRDLVENGASNGFRNLAAQKLSLNLVGTARRLYELGIDYDSDPRALYNQFCALCTPPLGSDVRGEDERWWRNADVIAKRPSLDDEKLQGCYDAWLKKQQGENKPPSVRGGEQAMEINEAELLKLEIKRLNAEKDPAKRAVIAKKLRKQGYGNSEIKEIATSLDTGARVPKARFFTPAQFREHVPDGLTWLFPGLLPSVGITLIGGNPGAGKSLLAYDCAASLLFGEEFLGEKPTRSGKVLFVVSDEPETFVQDKLINRGFYASDDWAMLYDWDESQWDVLEDKLEEFRPQLVIIDSFASIHRNESFDENSAQAKNTLYKLNGLLSRYNAGGVMIHHLNKSKDAKGIERFRGSTAIAAAGCFCWIIQGEGLTKKLTTPKVRGTAPIELEMALDPYEGRYKVLSGNEEKTACMPLAKRIRELFISIGGEERLEINEIKSRVGGNYEAIAKSLNRLCAEGVVAKAPSKKDPRRKVYYLSPKYVKDIRHLPPPPLTFGIKMSKVLAETHMTEGVGILDKTLDKPWTNPGQTLDIFLDQPLVQDTQNQLQSDFGHKPWTSAPTGGEGGHEENVQHSEVVIQDTSIEMVTDTLKPLGFSLQVGARVASADLKSPAYHWHGRITKMHANPELCYVDYPERKGLGLKQTQIVARLDSLRKL